MQFPVPTSNASQLNSLILQGVQLAITFALGFVARHLTHTPQPPKAGR